MTPTIEELEDRISDLEEDIIRLHKQISNILKAQIQAVENMNALIKVLNKK